jgi:hypothetical protein
VVLDDDLRSGLGVALNEASLLGFEVDPDRRLAAATFDVLSLPKQGSAPEDRRVQFRFSPVGRVVASLRDGRWDDAEAEVVPFEIGDLLSVVQSFGGLPVYGWEFFDVDAAELPRMRGRHSLDWRSGQDGVSHSIHVFQEGPRFLDLIVWFDDFAIFTPDGTEIAIPDFIAGGVRWWDALHSGDSRADGFGIIPLSPRDA